jgi:hypothetical protein
MWISYLLNFDVINFLLGQTLNSRSGPQHPFLPELRRFLEQMEAATSNISRK